LKIFSHACMKTSHIHLQKLWRTMVQYACTELKMIHKVSFSLFCIL
jgi:hypothetical protein